MKNKRIYYTSADAQMKANVEVLNKKIAEINSLIEYIKYTDRTCPDSNLNIIKYLDLKCSDYENEIKRRENNVENNNISFRTFKERYNNEYCVYAAEDVPGFYEKGDTMYGDCDDMVVDSYIYQPLTGVYTVYLKPDKNIKRNER